MIRLVCYKLHHVHPVRVCRDMTWAEGPSCCSGVRAALRGCRCADFVLLNKVDMLKEGDLEGLSQIAASLNPLAKVTPVPNHHT